MTEAQDAAAALDTAAAMDRAVRRESRWYTRYLAAFGVAAGLSTAIIGLVPGPLGVSVATALWVGTIAALTGYAARSRVSRRGLGLRHGVVIGSWAVLYAVVLACGLAAFPGDARWWLPGAVAVALPGLLGALAERRR